MKNGILVLILLLTPGLIGNISVQASFQLPEIRIIEDKVENAIEIPFGDMIYFFDDIGDYLANIKSDNLVQAYPNLMALRVSGNTELEGEYTRYTSSSFTKQVLHTSSSSLSQNPLSVNSLEGYDGSGITIAVLDNGIDFNHPNLQGKEKGSYFAGYQTLPQCYNHGTPVAGLAAGGSSNDFSGIASGSDLYDISFSCNRGSIEGDFLAAFEHVIEMNSTLDIINTSFGGFAPVWDEVIERVTQAGIIVVGSAGNTGPSSHTTTTGGPGNSIHAISVGSLGNDRISGFSSRGPAYQMTVKPDFVEYGEQILSTNENEGFGSYTGTSFSSPQVAGTIALLLEALQAQGISYNPGLIKAALAETAIDLGYDEYSQGRGALNISKAFELIGNQNQSAGIVTLNPTSGTPYYLSYVPQGATVHLPVGLTTSNPGETIITLGDDFTGISVPTLQTSYSQQLFIEIDTSIFSANSDITGSVTATLGNYSVSQSFALSVGNPVKGTVALDRYHSYWDQFGANQIGGSNTGEMLKLALEADLQVIEINTPIDEAVLGNVDILWMADPFNVLSYPGDDLAELGFSEGALSNTEITVLHEFVENGKNLFVTTLGSLENEGGNAIFGLNTTAFDQLLEPYGISASSTPIKDQTSPSVLPLQNQSSLVGSGEFITYGGNYLDVQSPSWSIAGRGDQVGIALYENQESHGKVLISSSNYWTDNIGILGGYGSGADNKVLSENVWKWFTEGPHLIRGTSSLENNDLDGTFFTPIGASNIEVSGRIGDGESTNLQFETNGNSHSFMYQLQGEGRYQVTASAMIDSRIDYVGWDVIVDNSGPILTVSSANPNGSRFDQSGFLVLKFHIIDDVSVIDRSTLEVIVNDGEITTVNSFNGNNDELQVIVSSNLLQNNSTHHLYLSIEDIFGNPSSITYEFIIGYLEVTTSSLQISTNTGRTSFSIFILSPLLHAFIKRRRFTTL